MTTSTDRLVSYLRSFSDVYAEGRGGGVDKRFGELLTEAADAIERLGDAASYFYTAILDLQGCSGNCAEPNCEVRRGVELIHGPKR